MALDEVLLEQAENDGAAWLRLYSWQAPTLSLGYFQPHHQRAAHPASALCPMLRRASGGGAILHDQELTYCIALPQSHRLARRPECLYQAVHESIVCALAELDIQATLRTRAIPTNRVSTDPTSGEPFLCFLRRTAGDVMLGDHKVAGSAQRRRRGAVLQHGSLLLAQSKSTPELPGVKELTGRTIGLQRLREVWQPKLADRLGAELREERLPEAVVRQAQELARQKFGSDQWTHRR